METSTSMPGSASIFAKAAMAASLSSADIRPCRIPMRSPARGPAVKYSAVSMTEVNGRFDSASSSISNSSKSSSPPSSPMRGHTTKTRWPAATSSRTRCQARSTWAGFSFMGTTCVMTPARPSGSPSRVEISRSPNTVIATVRGIGVAVMTNT
ncbi:unannotated protein [freshwater metagenome]|uniref:Unannotated protein n=1 Tax=freshwater metagenome TaxID=449393 RepID=A0A6J7GP53_9ZZZZ